MAARARVDEVSFVHGLYDIAEGEFKGILSIRADLMLKILLLQLSSLSSIRCNS